VSDSLSALITWSMSPRSGSTAVTPICLHDNCVSGKALTLF
jgi:hypothetical protein